MNMAHSVLFPSKFLLSFQYFLYFGVMGMVLPYFNLYFFHIGLSGFQIGVISAVRSSILVLFSIMWSLLADRFQIRGHIFLYGLLLSTGIWFFYLFTINFWLILIITIAYGVFYSPIISFLEAFTMDAIGEDKVNYGKIRVWGSISFILVVSLIGKVINDYSIKIILILVLFLSGFQVIVSFGIRRFSNQRKIAPSFQTAGFMKMPILIFLICAFLMLASHGAYYGFFSIHLENLGFNRTFIGLMWAVSAAAEIIVMVKSKAILKRFPIHQVLVFSFMAAALRWFTLFFVGSSFWIVLSQMLHAFTYGAFHVSSILYVDSLTPETNKTLGQAANNAVTYGLGLMSGFLISGALYERLGTNGLFLVSGVIALSGGSLFFGFHELCGRNTIRKQPF